MGQPIPYEQAFQASLKYFNGNDLAAKVFVDKYALRDKEQRLLEETPDDMHKRIASEIHRIEKKKFKKPMSFDEIFSYLKDFKKIIPQGSAMYGIGNQFQYISLANCFCLAPPQDSYGGIHWTDQQLTQVSKRRGGCGICLSKLRPSGTPTTNAAKTSSGIISFMERYSHSIREVGQRGRRGALLMSLSVHHPEILRFISAKQNVQNITGANISVKLSDEFLDAVSKDKQYELRWPVDSEKPTISRKIRAKEVWDKIIKNSTNNGEPGILFWSTIIRESPADCYASKGFKSVGCNPCSEIILGNLGSCLLLLMNMVSYVKNPFTKEAYFDTEEFYKDAKIAQRLADDIIDLEFECIDRIIDKVKRDPEEDKIKFVELDTWQTVKQVVKKGRRTGTGASGLGDTLAALGIKYASKKCFKVVDTIYKTLKLGVYRSSVDMAKELSPFPVWEHKLEKDNPFLLRIKDEDPELWKDMKKYGRMNIACLTSSPAGSTSILAQTTSGIEPLFRMSYTRRKKVNINDEGSRIDFVDKSGDAWQNFEVRHPMIDEWSRITGKDDLTESPWFGSCAPDIDWQNRVKLQAIATKYIDHSISSTINLPESATVEDVAKIYESSWKAGIKGITVYRENSRMGVIVENANDGCDDCKKPVKREQIQNINKSHAPKRPKELPCDVYHTSVKGEMYFVVVGLLNDEPYEIFAGQNGEIPRNYRKGTIKKIKRGNYKLFLEGGKEVESLSDFSKEDEEALNRMTSTALRHGADISFVVHQLEKVKGDLQSLAKSLARSLKKYIVDGTTITGEVCQECKMDSLVRESGCIKCSNCGWSRCS